MTQTQALAVVPANGAPAFLTLTGGTSTAVDDPIPTGVLRGQSRAMIDALKATVAKGAPDEQLAIYLMTAIKLGLNPVTKDIWCVNMAGPSQAAQWMISPSRDGLLKMAMRHPNYKDHSSDVVREGDDYSFDGVNGVVVHKKQGMKARPGPIVGAWCLVLTKDGRRIAKEVYSCDVRGGSPIWQKHEAKMTVKCAETLGFKAMGAMSGDYADEKVFDRIDAVDTERALLVNTTEGTLMIDGMVVGDVAPARPVAAQTSNVVDAEFTEAPPEKSPAQKVHGALMGEFSRLAGTVPGATIDDASAARHFFMGGASTKGMLPEIKQDWLNALNSGPERYQRAVAEARDARLAAAKAAEAPEAEALDEDIPPFEAAAVTETTVDTATGDVEIPIQDPDLWAAVVEAMPDLSDPDRVATLTAIVKKRFGAQSIDGLMPAGIKNLTTELREKTTETLALAIPDEPAA